MAGATERGRFGLTESGSIMTGCTKQVYHPSPFRERWRGNGGAVKGKKEEESARYII
jgi:hypothetical protein